MGPDALYFRVVRPSARAAPKVRACVYGAWLEGISDRLDNFQLLRSR